MELVHPSPLFSTSETWRVVALVAKISLNIAAADDELPHPTGRPSYLSTFGFAYSMSNEPFAIP